jgi:hypothetical protein
MRTPRYTRHDGYSVLRAGLNDVRVMRHRDGDDVAPTSFRSIAEAAYAVGFALRADGEADYWAAATLAFLFPDALDVALSAGRRGMDEWEDETCTAKTLAGVAAHLAEHATLV